MAAVTSTGFHAKCYIGMSGEVLDVGPFQHRVLDKDEPPSVTAAKLKQKLQEVHGQPVRVKLVSIAGAAPLAEDAFCELDRVDSTDVGVRYQCIVDTTPDQLFVLVSTYGDEGCPRVCTQEVSITEAFPTKQLAEAFRRKQWPDEPEESSEGCMRRLSLQKIKACPEVMAMLSDHVYALLKVETDSGGPANPYFRFYKFAFVDKASAANLAIKFYKSSLWSGKDEVKSESDCNAESDMDDDGIRSDCSSDLGSHFENSSDCEDYLQDLSSCDDSNIRVLEDYGTSIWIVKLNLPPASGEMQRLCGGAIQGLVGRKQKAKELARARKLRKSKKPPKAKEPPKANKQHKAKIASAKSKPKARPKAEAGSKRGASVASLAKKPAGQAKAKAGRR